MKSVTFVTTNSGKFDRFSQEVAKYGISAVRLNTSLPEVQSDYLDIIVKGKVRSAYERIAGPCIVQDSGFFINTLAGFPGPYTKYALSTLGLPGILKLVEGRPRGCAFISGLGYLDESVANPVYFESKIEGTVAKRAEGDIHPWAHHSILHRIFIPTGSTKTEAAMSQEEYEALRRSREAKSVIGQFAEWFLKN